MSRRESTSPANSPETPFSRASFRMNPPSAASPENRLSFQQNAFSCGSRRYRSRKNETSVSPPRETSSSASSAYPASCGSYGFRNADSSPRNTCFLPCSQFSANALTRLCRSL